MAKGKVSSLLNGIGGRNGDVVYYMWGDKLCSRKYVVPANPDTEAQHCHRSLFAEAMAAWKLLSEDEKQVYRKKSRKLRIHGHNLFIKQYMKSHKHEKAPETRPARLSETEL